MHKQEDKPMKETSTMLSVDVLHEHPQNPRKSIGDISELTESIKKNGIMQNLTVIPGHWEGEKFIESEYTLLIGHRRFNAAKAAGVKEVPCRIIESMDEKEQLSVMLEENMQRADLTIWEQATGFQLMLDLGDTEEGLAEKTGFSKQTIRHRLNIAKLDGKEIKKKEQDDSFQLTLKDLYELEKIEDIKTRNKVLKDARDSRELAWKAHQAAEQEKMDKRAAIIIKILKAAGVKEAPEKVTHEMYSGKWEIVKEWDLRNEKEPKLAKATQAGIQNDWLWYRYYGSVKLVKPTPKKKEKKEADPTEKNKKELKKMVKELMVKKHTFINEVITGKLDGIKEEYEACEQLWDVLVNINTYLGPSELRRFFTGKADYEALQEAKDEANDKLSKLHLVQKMLIQLDYAMDNVGDLMDWRCRYNESKAQQLTEAFKILKKWGWTFEDEEKSILDGTHELYTKEG